MLDQPSSVQDFLKKKGNSFTARFDTVIEALKSGVSLLHAPSVAGWSSEEFQAVMAMNEDYAATVYNAMSTWAANTEVEMLKKAETSANVQGWKLLLESRLGYTTQAGLIDRKTADEEAADIDEVDLDAGLRDTEEESEE
jgi:hypothetical protein